mgnify:CR=1 FL=1
MLGNLPVRHLQAKIHEDDFSALFGKRIQGIRQPVALNEDLLIAYGIGSTLAGVGIADRKLFHVLRQQFAEIDLPLLSAPDLSVGIIGFILQRPFAKAIKGVLLVFLMLLSRHNLTPSRLRIVFPFHILLVPRNMVLAMSNSA